jgi:uncharacterized membrane protein YjdF
MLARMSDSAPTRPHTSPETHRGLYMRLTLVVQLILAAGLVIFLLRRDWENVFLTVCVISLTLLPALLSRRVQIVIPPEFQFISALFVFLSLFLGSAGDFYYKFWWWDLVLHTGSGFLLGIVGFIAVFALNRSEQLPRGMRPFFVCVFAVTFAVTLGVIWEIFEFTVDRFTDANMQSQETGVVDTMKDLIVDTLGAVVVAAMGWAWHHTGRYSFIADAVAGFVKKNPALFKQGGAGTSR